MNNVPTTNTNRLGNRNGARIFLLLCLSHVVERREKVMKYSELKSYLELAHWENESDDDYIKVYRNGYTVAVVGLWEQYNIRILDPTQMTEGLYRRLTELATTPLTERKDEKRYYLRLVTPPILKKQVTEYLRKSEYLEYYTTGLSKNTGDEKIKTIFTESEIAEMDITGFEKIEVTP